MSALAIDGVLCALATAFCSCRWYLGSVPFPISAVLAGVVNLALVWAGNAVGDLGLGWPRCRCGRGC